MAPWGERLLPGPDGGVETGEPDARPEAEIAAEIVAADPKPEGGDGETPPDPVEALTDFVTGVRGTWLRGDRARLRSSGPVGSSRFM
ncbi:hypothetical protein [Streptomyces sp. NPDC102282]|uniref:hypothetical protein n=1 Tax=Streptomyces sp. NPDC102282 TaxID=3366154 RepID=UPI0038011F6B